VRRTRGASRQRRPGRLRRIHRGASRCLLSAKQIPSSDAVRSAGNAAAIAAAFASWNYEALRGCFDDGLHQPYRASLVPQLDRVITAGVKAGALGGWLSGSGSTIACLVLDGDANAVAVAMKRASGLKTAATVVVAPDNRGVVVKEI